MKSKQNPPDPEQAGKLRSELDHLRTSVTKCDDPRKKAAMNARIAEILKKLQWARG